MEQTAFDLAKMLKGKIAFEDSKTVWQIQLADFLANTWARTINDYCGITDHRVLFRDFYCKNALPNDTPIGVVSLSDETNRSNAPTYWEIFARMIRGDTKILPCD